MRVIILNISSRVGLVVRRRASSGYTGLLCTACWFNSSSESFALIQYTVMLEQDWAANSPAAGHKLLFIWIIIYESRFIKQIVVMKDIKTFCERRRDCGVGDCWRGGDAVALCAEPFLCCFLFYGLTFLLIGCHVFTLRFCWSPSQVISPPLPAKASPSDP